MQFTIVQDRHWLATLVSTNNLALFSIKNVKL